MIWNLKENENKLFSCFIFQISGLYNDSKPPEKS